MVNCLLKNVRKSHIRRAVFTIRSPKRQHVYGMPSIMLDSKLIWFAHCPKAGGTSIETMMVTSWKGRVEHLDWGWAKRWRAGKLRHADPPCSPQHLTWDDAEKVLPHRPDHVFAVVREPLARLQSEYRWQRSGGCRGKLGKALSYLPFFIWLRVMLAMAERHPYVFDNHFRPQTDFIPESATVFRLENGLEPVVAWLSDVTESDLPEAGHHLPTLRRMQPVDQRDVALVEAVFAADYARFGYPIRASKAAKRTVLDHVVSLLAPMLIGLDRRGLL